MKRTAELAAAGELGGRLMGSGDRRLLGGRLCSVRFPSPCLITACSSVQKSCRITVPSLRCSLVRQLCGRVVGLSGSATHLSVPTFETAEVEVVTTGAGFCSG